MNITVNAKQTQTPDSASIADLIAQLGMNPKYVAVEVNKKLVTRAKHADHILTEGDVVEIVTLVGGG